MTLEEIDARLQSIDKAEIRNGWTILDTQGDETYGLNFSKVTEVARELGRDACLADELYASHNHDLKVLATYIDDPDSYSKDELSMRSSQLYPSPFADKFCHQVIAKSPYAVHFMDEWRKDEDPSKRCYAYMILDELAKNKNNLADDFFGLHVSSISETIHEEADEVKQAMHQALLSIGCRDAELKKECIKAARDIGQVSFETGKKINPVLILQKKLSQKRSVNT